MLNTPAGRAIQHLRSVVLRRDTTDVPDGQLLTWFVERADEAAFEALVRRHGPMVLGVCRRILHDLQEADDAFQATFLVLVRKAGSVVPRDLVANWLYGVARTTALRARVNMDKRRRRERPTAVLPEGAAEDPALWSDLEPVLDEELRHLPDKYRAPILLCDLEGRSHKDAARQLGWPVGTLSGRLSRARALLGRRLTRRGVTLCGAALGSVLARNALAGVPAPVLRSTVKAARLLTAGRALTTGVTSARVAELTTGVLKTMLLLRVRVTGLPLLLLTLVCLGIPALSVFGQKDPPRRPAAAADPDPKAILLKSAAACREVREIEYVEEQSRTTGPARPPRLTATVRQARADVADAGYLAGRYVVEGEVERPALAPTKFGFAYDGTTLRVLDPARQTVVVVQNPDARAAGRLLGPEGQTGLPPFTQPQPFQPLLDAAVRFDYGGTRDVKGTSCHVITLTSELNDPVQGKRSVTATWFIGREDYLPRGNEIGAVRRLVRVRRVNPPAPSRPFTLATPAGYAEKPATGNEAKTAGLLAVGSAAPDWTLTDPGGRSHTLKEYRGRVVVLDFWGVWCVPCRKSMPALQAVHDRFKDRGVAVLGISVGDKEVDPAAYMKRAGFTYGLLLKGEDVATSYKAVVLPTVYVLGPDGKVVHAESGARENLGDELQAVVEKAVKGGGK